MILSWRDPIDESFPLIQRARRLALDVGEHQYAAYTIISIIFAMITSGKSLHVLQQGRRRALAVRRALQGSGLH